MKTRIQTFLTICLFMSATLFLGCSDDSSTGPDPDTNISLSEALTDSSNADLSILAQTITDLGLQAQLDSQQDVTVFAPTNSAFEELPEGVIESLSQEQLTEIIEYHIGAQVYSSEDLGGQENLSIPTVQGDSIFVRSRNTIDLNHTTAITEADIATSSGFVHKIDELLMPDSYLDTYEIARKRYQLAKFTCSCTSGRTGLASVLRNTDNMYTVFAPTDAAFDILEESLEGDLDDVPDMQLDEILSYHIIEGQRLTSTDLTDGMELTTLNGATLTVSVADDGTVSLNDGEAAVEVTDIEGTNGVVHEIGTVLEAPGGHGDN
jgi:transforming growth factor-beta-induced protein